MNRVSRTTVTAMLLLLSFTKAEREEPSCSKFDFDEKVLEKVVRLEYKVEQIENKQRELDEKVDTVIGNSSVIEGIGRGTLCPDRTTPYEGSCYFAGPTAITPISSAQEFCQDRKMKLVQVDTPREQLFLSKWLAQLGGSLYWIGVTDMNREGVWTGLDDNMQVNFTAWGPGEPKGGTSENCACFEINFQYSWADVMCGRHTCNPLCEYRS